MATKRRVRQLTVLMVAGALLAAAAAPAGGQPAQPARAGRDARGVAVTLLTGDKVILRRTDGSLKDTCSYPGEGASKYYCYSAPGT